MNAKLHGDNIGYYPSGSKRHEYQFKEGGKYGSNYDYFENGKIQIKEQFAYNGKDSKKSEMADNGNVIYEKEFRDGKPHGTWVYYFIDGKTTKLKEQYENGTRFVKRFRHSVWLLIFVGNFFFDFT